MGFKLDEAYVEIGGRMGGLDRSLATARRNFDRTVSYARAAGRRVGSAFEAGVGTLKLAAFGGGLAGGGFAGGLAYAVKQASDLNESLNKVQVVFGKSSGILTAAADRMAKQYGTASGVILDAGANIGLVAKASGLAEARSAALGAQLAGLAADAASFYNVGLDEALEKIRSGLVGESEPIRSFGVLLSEAAVKAEAARMGLARMGAELSEGQKVQARASLIVKGLSSASGDLARTQDSVSNRTREVYGRFQNLAAQLGQKLLPAAQRLGSELSYVLSDVANGDKLSGAVKVLGGYLEAAARGVGILYRNFGDVARLAGSAFNGLIENARRALDTIGANVGELGAYMGRVISAAIQDGIASAVRAIPDRFGDVLSMLPGGQRIADTIRFGHGVRPGMLDQVEPPQFRGFQFAQNQGMKDALSNIRAKEFGFAAGQAMQAAIAKGRGAIGDMLGRAGNMQAAQQAQQDQIRRGAMALAGPALQAFLERRQRAGQPVRLGELQNRALSMLGGSAQSAARFGGVPLMAGVGAVGAAAGGAAAGLVNIAPADIAALVGGLKSVERAVKNQGNRLAVMGR